MNYREFCEVFGDDPVIDIRNVATYFGGLDRRRLYEWQQRGLIIKLANNFYVPANKRVDGELLKTAACRLYEPSYIGLYSALAWYNLIPEAVFQVTAITTRRNKRFSTPIGDFQYRSIKRELFFGVQLGGAGNNKFRISDPEKTILDFLHFTAGSDHRETLEEMRLNVIELKTLLDWARLERYLRLFSSPKLERAAQRLKEMADAES
jgi:predicted transcriptional regulator of viral defense system